MAADRTEVAHNCREHPHEVAEGICRSCGASYCADCLVYPFGASRPPLCVPCAIAAGGVRKSARKPTVVVPKEKKRRLKEWRQARKRDLANPPPDGVATWHLMDERARADDEVETGEAALADDLEALRLPPAEPEPTPPPPDVNLAPPGPAGSDWREDVEPPALNFGPPGSSFDTLDPLEADLPAPDPTALRVPAVPEATDPVPFEPAPPAFEPPAAAFEPTSVGIADPDAAWTPPAIEPVLGTTAAASPSADEPRPPTITPPEPFAPEPSFAAEPFTAEPSFTAEPFPPAPFAPEPFAPQPFLGAADEGGPEGFPAVPGGPVTIDMGGDPLAASLGTPDPVTAFGLDDLPPPPPEFDEAPVPPPEPTAPVGVPPVAGGGVDDEAEPAGPGDAADQGGDPVPPVRRSPRKRAIPPPPPVDGDPAEVGIRPRTPTRIPAAGAASGEAKAMLDRIAALRSRPD